MGESNAIIDVLRLRGEIREASAALQPAYECGAEYVMVSQDAISRAFVAVSRIVAALDAAGGVCCLCEGWINPHDLVPLMGMKDAEASAHLVCASLDAEMASHGGHRLPTWVYEFASRQASPTA
jgi:hypothetical protein